MSPLLKTTVVSLAILLSLPILLMVVWLGWFLLDSSVIHTRIPDTFLIPKGYEGWVRIDFSVPDSPALQVVNKHLIFRIGKDGTLKTSSKFKSGWRRQEYAWGTTNTFTLTAISRDRCRKQGGAAEA
jgi:hypothetical protein